MKDVFYSFYKVGFYTFYAHITSIANLDNDV